MPQVRRSAQGQSPRFFGGQRRSTSVLSFNHDGLEIARTKRERRWLPIWHVIFFIYLILLIRLVTMAQIGPGGYAMRMDEMQNGNAVEQVAARIMAMDPISQRLAVKIRGGLQYFGSL